MNRGRQHRVAELLVDNIHSELVSAAALTELDLDEVVLLRMAESVAASVLYAFTIDWSPDWVAAGEPHAWQTSGHWYARCTECLTDSPPAPNREAAVHWATDHPHAAGVPVDS